MVLVYLVGFIASFAFSQGAVIWVIPVGDLPELGTCQRTGAGEFHALVLGRGDDLVVPDGGGIILWRYRWRLVSFLCSDDIAPNICGEGIAGNEGEEFGGVGGRR